MLGTFKQICIDFFLIVAYNDAIFDCSKKLEKEGGECDVILA
jgi:hypothetical protein